MENNGNLYALVTGSSRGMRALAEECAKRGWNLMMTSLPGENLPEVSKEIAEKYKIKTDFWEGDMTADGAAEQILNFCKGKGYGVACLINNAGFGQHGPFELSKHNVNMVMMKLNMLVTVSMIQYFLPEIKRHPSGWILNVSSLGGLSPSPFKAVYGGTKAFSYSFSRALQRELRKTNVHVGVVAPGAVITNESVKARIEAAGAMAKKTAFTPEELAKYTLDKFFNKKVLIIPGFLNKVIYWLGRHLPPAFMIAQTEKTLGKPGEGGFV